MDLKLTITAVDTISINIINNWIRSKNFIPAETALKTCETLEESRSCAVKERKLYDMHIHNPSNITGKLIIKETAIAIIATDPLTTPILPIKDE